jgi:hypothetical protein
MRRALPILLLAALLLLPAGAQAHTLSVSAARAEAAFYAGDLVQRGKGARFKVTSCRRHSAHAVSCGFKIYGPRGYRISGRVRTEHAGSTSYDTISRATVARA